MKIICTQAEKDKLMRSWKRHHICLTTDRQPKGGCGADRDCNGCREQTIEWEIIDEGKR